MKIMQGRVVPLLVLAVSTAGCGATLQVQGAQFRLNAAETWLANKYAEGDPVGGLPTVRCNYWTARPILFGMPQPVGNMMWRPDQLQNLAAWTRATANDVCSIAETQRAQVAAATAREAQAVQQKSRADAAAARVVAEAAEANLRRDVRMKALEEVEQGLRDIHEPWTDDSLHRFAMLKKSMEDMSSSPVPLPPTGQARFTAATETISSLFPSFQKAAEAYDVRFQKEEAKRQKDEAQRQAREEREQAAQAAIAARSAIPTGRQLILSHLSAPSTAHFVSESVLLQCGVGGGLFVTRHTVDAQNGFGAMIRHTYCPRFIPVKRLVADQRSEEGDIEPYFNCDDGFGHVLTCDNVMSGSNHGSKY